MKSLFLGLGILVCLLNAPECAWADPAALQEFKTDLQPALGLANAAVAAVYCNVRSNQWVAPFGPAMIISVQQEFAKLHLTETEKDSADAWIKNMTQQELLFLVGEHSSKCGGLAGSLLMHNLDMAHDQITGGYR